MAALVSVADIKVFLKDEATDNQNDALIAACETQAEALVNNYADDVLADYTSADLPTDLKTAIIDLSLSKFISATTNVNYVQQGETIIDRASRFSKEAYAILDKYRTPKVA